MGTRLGRRHSAGKGYDAEQWKPDWAVDKRQGSRHVMDMRLGSGHEAGDGYEAGQGTRGW